MTRRFLRRLAEWVVFPEELLTPLLIAFWFVAGFLLVGWLTSR